MKKHAKLTSTLESAMSKHRKFISTVEPPMNKHKKFLPTVKPAKKKHSIFIYAVAPTPSREQIQGVHIHCLAPPKPTKAADTKGIINNFISAVDTLR